MIEFFDTHAHLDFPDFAEDLPQILDRAAAAGVTRIISIGTTLESSRRAVELAEKYPPVYAAVGWHPSYVSSAPAELPGEFRELVAHPKVVAIGETGLDFSRLPENGAEEGKARQRALFKQQLDLAAESGLNVIIHQREAFKEVIDLLTPHTPRIRAVFHCFVGTSAEQRAVASIQCLVSFTGIVTFKNAVTVREALKAASMDDFMLETDCPFLAPVPYRGKRCEPAHVAETAAFIAREKGCAIEELSTRTCETAREFFRKLR